MTPKISEPISKEESQNLLFMQPVFLEKIWGGRRLETEFGYAIPDGPIGECWAISAHPHGDCKVINGAHKGAYLSEVWKRDPRLFSETESTSPDELKPQHEKEPFPLLVKIIDADADLSVQVHPDDAYADRYENGSLGKQECWYVLAADPGATIVVGQKASSKAEFEELMAQGKWDDLLNEIPIKKGDFFQIDPGTVHAIKGGTMVLETQQSSDVTYRLYDYDRLDDAGNPRPLHIQQSLDVIDFERPLIFDGALQLSENGVTLLEKNENYTVLHVALSGGSEGVTDAQGSQDSQNIKIQNEAGFLCVSVIAGEAVVEVAGAEKPLGVAASAPAESAISVASQAPSERVRLAKGDHFICPANVSSLTFAGNAELILSHP